MTEAARHGVRDMATDPAAFEVFYREQLPLVRVYLARRIDEPADVADLTADIFLAAIRAAKSYRADLGPPRAWLIGIARHVLADHRRSRARERAAVNRLAGRRLLDEDSTQRIVDRITAEASHRELLDSFAALPESLRAVVELVAVDELSIAEAAGVLGIKPGTARVRYHRARKRLRTLLLPHPTEVTS